MVLTSFIVFASWFIQGISGFGSAVFMITFLSFFINIKSAVITLVFIQALGPLSILFFVKVHKLKINSIYVVLYLVIGSIIGVGIGTQILKIISITSMEILCGIFFLSIGIFDITIILNKNNTLNIFPKLKPRYGLIVGAFSGIFSALAGSGGPPVAIYLRNIFREFDEYRFLISLYFVFIITIRLSYYYGMNLIHNIQYRYILWWGISSILGLWSGRYISKYMKSKYLHISVPILVIICGILLLIKALNLT